MTDPIREALDGHSLTVFAPATDDVTIRCDCNAEAMSEEAYWEHLRAALAAPAEPREHVTDADDPLACWCDPYRDTVEPSVIVHRKEGAA